jgi:hypothetical protein
MQDEVTTRLARAVHIALIAAESRRAAHGHPDRLDAVDYTLRGLAAWNKQAEWRSKALPAFKRLTVQAERLIAGIYLGPP